MIGNMRIHEYSGEELERIARESFVPVRFRAGSDFQGRMALQEMGQAVTLSRADTAGPHRNLRTERMATKTSGDDVLIFIIHLAGENRVQQHDRLFERIGTTPGAYLRKQRLLAARAMLSDPRYARLGVSDVADAVGFLGRRTFELAFRREYGMTPGCWRREHLRAGPLGPGI